MVTGLYVNKLNYLGQRISLWLSNDIIKVNGKKVILFYLFEDLRFFVDIITGFELFGLRCGSESGPSLS